MGVKSGYAYSWMGNAELAAGVVEQFGHFDNAGFLHQVTGLAKWHMGRDVYHTQILVGQQHGVFLGVGEGGVNFGVTIEHMTALVKSRLVQGGGNRAVYLMVHGQVDGGLYRQESGMTALGLLFAELETAHVHAGDVVYVDGALCEFSFLHTVDDVDSKWKTQMVDDIPNHSAVARYKGTAHGVYLGM